MPDGLDVIRQRLPELLTRVEYDSSAEYEQARADVERLLAIAEAAQHYVDGMAGDSPGALGDALDALDQDTPQ